MSWIRNIRRRLESGRQLSPLLAGNVPVAPREMPLPPEVDELEDDLALAVTEDRQVAVASQWQLMWWKFRKHKQAVLSALVVKPGHYAACHYSEVLNLRGVDVQASQAA